MKKKRRLHDGDQIIHYRYGPGVITRANLSYGVLVHFDRYGDMRVPFEDIDQMENRTALLASLAKRFQSDFLSADQFFATHPDKELISHEEYADLKRRFVLEWAERELSLKLDVEQAIAIASTEGNIQVVARAGSGKTRTLVTRAIFLQQHCKISPRELLLLAFNKKAAQEMKSRLASTLGNDLPYVMTFHALAHALVHPEEDLVFDDASADQFKLSREVQEVIDQHIRSDQYRHYIRELMLAHFREDWERIIDGRFHLTVEAFLAHRRALPRESLKGDYVKSFGEKVIANALFEHGISYIYERNHRWDGVNYRPDFTIPTSSGQGVIIEYFGLTGDADYDIMAQRKREFWSRREGWALIEFSPSDLMLHGVGGFVGEMLRQLRGLGIPSRRRSEEEIWQLIEGRALDSFTNTMRTFVGRCRKRGLAPNDLEMIVSRHTPCSEAERLFLQIGVSIYRNYLQRLSTQSKDDFDGLMWRSALLVRSGQTHFKRDKNREQGDVRNLRFVLIDEFQDFSQMFFELVDAMRSVHPRLRFFCVGDDWQAINGFAGSDLRFFDRFSEYFHDASRNYISTNYRSARLIVEVSNAVMRDRGTQAKPHRPETGLIWLCNLDNFTPSVAERARHRHDEITPAVLRLVGHFLNRGQDVVLLSRRRGIPWYIDFDEAKAGGIDELTRFQEWIRSFLPEKDRRRVTASTAHGYKGLEQSAVVVLDAVERSYPLIHPTWSFLRVFGDSIERIDDEERRLFYVAVTRARDSLALITESRMVSSYLGDIHQHTHLQQLQWNQLAPIASSDSLQLEIRVLYAYEIKEQLKNQGFKFDSKGKCWRRAVRAEGFSFDTLLTQPWAKTSVKIEVYTETGQLLHRR